MKKDKTKKPFTLTKAIIIYAVCIIVAVALIVGNYFANLYENLITVFFSSSEYETTEEEKELCKQVEAEGIVLLKKENNALPLDGDESVALLGQDSVDFVYGGSGSGSVDSSTAPTLKDAMEASGFTVNQTLWDFYSTGAGSSYRKTYPDESGNGSFAVNEVPQSVYTSSVLSSMDSNDAGIVVLGRSGGESSDLPTTALSTGYLYLEPDANELALLELACEKFNTVILIVNPSNAMELGVLDDDKYSNVKAAIWVGGVGQEGMYAIGEVLNGNVNPSGRLADTYAYDSLSAPSAANLGDYSITNSSVDKGNKYIVYQEGIYVGYRYYETRYEDYVLGQGNAGEYDYASTVQYPFGYGLSYTEFTWSDYEVTMGDDEITVNVTVKNTGEIAGKDVVEVYMQSPYTEYDKENGVEKSAVELVGFAKTPELEAGEEYTVTVTVEKSVMASYDSQNAETYVVDEGIYYFAAGTDAHNALNNILSAKGVSDSSLSGDNINSKLVYAYEQTEFDNSTYSVSSSTGNKISNQFTDNYADINTYTDDCVYLTRSDWEGTLPQSAYSSGSMTASDEMLADLEFYRTDEVINDSSATMPTNSSTSTSYTVQQMTEVDYDDSKWDDIVNQLSVSQMTRLVRMGGYSTIQIDAIGLPSTIDKDGPSGISGTLVGGESTMAWPTEVVMSSTWNTELIEEMGVVIGQQSIDSGVAGWYAPGVNIHRSPYSGRNFEYFSEDGILSGKICAAEMRGVRSKGVIAYMKHFALNDQETNRYGGCIFANEQSIREIYLKGFEHTVTEGGASAAMASMNRIGTRWSGASKELMTYILRDEWGFKGMVITDQASVSGMFYQDMISGLWAGTDLWLNTNNNYWSLSDWTDNATVMSNVHRAAKNILYSVTNSNAVIDYESGGSSVKDVDTSMATWKILLYVADAVIWTACAVGIVVPTVLLIKNKKKSTIKAE